MTVTKLLEKQLWLLPWVDGGSDKSSNQFGPLLCRRMHFVCTPGKCPDAVVEPTFVGVSKFAHAANGGIAGCNRSILILWPTAGMGRQLLPTTNTSDTPRRPCDRPS